MEGKCKEDGGLKDGRQEDGPVVLPVPEEEVVLGVEGEGGGALAAQAVAPRPAPRTPGHLAGGASWDGGGGNDGGDAGDDGDIADLVSRVRRTDWPGPGWREVVQERAPSSPHSRGDGEGLKEQVKVQVKVKVDSPSQPPCELW